MPPSIKITKEEIIRTALGIVKKDGIKALNARDIAAKIGCSTQPIFSNFSSMEELQLEVIKSANLLYEDCLKAETNRGEYPVYKASGMAYIKFAKEEKELFKLLFMRNQNKFPNFDQEQHFNNMLPLVKNNTGLDTDKTALFHLEMWAFVHGIATMYATEYLNLELSLVSQMLTDAYLGLKKQYGVN